MQHHKEVKENVDLCLTPGLNISEYLPVPGGSDWAGSLKKIYKTLGTKDFSMVPGRGVFGHPEGPEAGKKHKAGMGGNRERRNNRGIRKNA